MSENTGLGQKMLFLDGHYLIGTVWMALFMIGGCTLQSHAPPGPEPNLVQVTKEIQQAIVTVAIYDINHKVSGFGTGFFINRQGHLITNHHVLEGAYEAYVKTFDGQTYSVSTILAENEAADLIKVQVDIPDSKTHWLEVTSEAPQIAERILVVGSPLGLDSTFARCKHFISTLSAFILQYCIQPYYLVKKRFFDLVSSPQTVTILFP